MTVGFLVSAHKSKTPLMRVFPYILCPVGHCILIAVGSATARLTPTTHPPTSRDTPLSDSEVLPLCMVSRDQFPKIIRSYLRPPFTQSDTPIIGLLLSPGACDLPHLGLRRRYPHLCCCLLPLHYFLEQDGYIHHSQHFKPHHHRFLIKLCSKMLLLLSSVILYCNIPYFTI